MAYINFRTLCYLGIGCDDDFSKCYDLYVVKTNIDKIADLTSMIVNMLKYNDELI